MLIAPEITTNPWTIYRITLPPTPQTPPPTCHPSPIEQHAKCRALHGKGSPIAASMGGRKVTPSLRKIFSFPFRQPINKLKISLPFNSPFCCPKSKKTKESSARENFICNFRSTWKSVPPPSQEAVVAAAEAFSVVRNWFANPSSRAPEQTSVSGTPSPLLPPPPPPPSQVASHISASFLPTSSSSWGLGFPAAGYQPYPGHRSSGFVPTASSGSRTASAGGSFLRGGKKRSHSQSSVNDLDIPSLTRSSQGSLNMLQAMQTSRSGISSMGGSYGHLSAGTCS